MKKTYYETISDELMKEGFREGETLIQVSDENDYIGAMEEQNKRVRDFLNNKYPDRYFRVGKWNSHDFGSYQEVEELIEVEIDEDEDEDEDITMDWNNLLTNY